MGIKGRGNVKRKKGKGGCERKESEGGGTGVEVKVRGGRGLRGYQCTQ